MLPKLQIQLAQIKKAYEEQTSSQHDKFLARERALYESILGYQQEVQALGRDQELQAEALMKEQMKVIGLEQKLAELEQEKAKAHEQKTPLPEIKEEGPQSQQEEAADAMSRFGPGDRRERALSSHIVSHHLRVSSRKASAPRVPVDNESEGNFSTTLFSSDPRKSRAQRSYSNFSTGSKLNVNITGISERQLEQLITSQENGPAKIGLLSRLVARLRSKHSRLLVQFNDLKKSSEDKIRLLTKALDREKNRRLKV